MDAQQAHRARTGIGAGSAAIGVALAARPDTGRALGLGRGTTAAVGVLDVAVGAAVLGAHPAWRGMLARAGANVVIAAALLRGGKTSGRVAAGVLGGLTCGDLLIARTLRSA